MLLGSGPSFESDGRVLNIYNDLINWSKSSGVTVFFKPHPRSDLSLWHTLVQKASAAATTGVLNKMPEARGALFAVAAYTNAVLDVADLNIPVIWMAAEDEHDHFRLEDFFMARASDSDQLHQRVKTICSNPTCYKNQAQLFRTYHLGEVDSPLTFVADTIRGFVKG